MASEENDRNSSIYELCTLIQLETSEWPTSRQLRMRMEGNPSQTRLSRVLRVWKDDQRKKVAAASTWADQDPEIRETLELLRRQLAERAAGMVRDEVATLRAEAVSRETELNGLRRRCSILETQVSDLQGDKDALIVSAKLMEEELGQERRESDMLRTKLAEAENDLSSMKAEMQRERARFSDELSSAVSRLEGLEAFTLRQTDEARQAAEAKWRSKAEAAENQLEMYRQMSNSLRMINSQQQAEIERLRSI